MTVSGGGTRQSLHDIVGSQFALRDSWTAADAVLFAAAVGADCGADIDYVDLSRGPTVMPTFLCARANRAGQARPDFVRPLADAKSEDTFVLACDIAVIGNAPAVGESETVGGYIEVWDKGSSAVLVSEFDVQIDGSRLLSFRLSVMIRGAGGFGGERGPSRVVPPVLDRAVELAVSIPANSGVLYQLVGEHNPHSLDPDVAAKAGLSGPISAGQVLIGAAGRTITTAFAGGDHRALTRIAVDYAGPHVTDQPLTMNIQQTGSTTFDFELHAGQRPVLVGGRAELG